MSKKDPPTCTLWASTTDYYRIIRAILRLQLYVHIGKRYQTTERRHRKVRALFSLLTTWEFDEVRSVATGIILAFREPYKNAEYLHQQHVCDFFRYLYARFEDDIAPFIRFRRGAAHDSHRERKCTKSSKIWADAAVAWNQRNVSWNPRYGVFNQPGRSYLGWLAGSPLQELYKETFLGGGFPLWQPEEGLGRFMVSRNIWRGMMGCVPDHALHQSPLQLGYMPQDFASRAIAMKSETNRLKRKRLRRSRTQSNTRMYRLSKK
jgi:hypothetical protein